MSDDIEKLKHRIAEIAVTTQKDYPNIAECDSMEQLYAISSGIQGSDLAIEDWSDFASFLIEKIHGKDNVPGYMLKEWDNWKRTKNGIQSRGCNSPC